MTCTFQFEIVCCAFADHLLSSSTFSAMQLKDVDQGLSKSKRILNSMAIR